MVRWVVGSILHGGPIDLFLTISFGEQDLAPKVRVFADGVMGHRIDPSWWTH